MSVCLPLCCGPNVEYISARLFSVSPPDRRRILFKIGSQESRGERLMVGDGGGGGGGDNGARDIRSSWRRRTLICIRCCGVSFGCSGVNRRKMIVRGSFPGDDGDARKRRTQPSPPQVSFQHYAPSGASSTVKWRCYKHRLLSLISFDEQCN